MWIYTIHFWILLLTQTRVFIDKFSFSLTRIPATTVTTRRDPGSDVDLTMHPLKKDERGDYGKRTGVYFVQSYYRGLGTA